MNDILSLINRLGFSLEPVFYKLVCMSLTASAIGLVIIFIRWLFDKKISPFWKSMLWLLVVASLVIPYRPASSLSLAGDINELESFSYRDDFDQNEKQLREMLIDDEAYEEEDAQRLYAKRDNLYIKSAFFDVFLPVAWLGGALSLGVFFLLARLSLNKKLKDAQIPTNKYDALALSCRDRLGLKLEPRVITQAYLKSPAVMGAFRPTIIMPYYKDDMDEKSLSYIILHELAHFKRGDLALNLVLLALNCIYWFNPFIWFVFKLIREDMELQNDSYVLKKLGEDSYKPYALSLAYALEQGKAQPFAPKIVCLVDNAKNVERRIKMLKLREKFSENKIAISVCCLAVMAILGVFFLTKPKKLISGDELIWEISSSLSYELGEISFKIPKNAQIDDDFSLKINGVAVGNETENVILFENETKENLWKAGKTYKIDPLQESYLELSLAISSSDKAYKTDLIKNYALVLAHKYRTDYVGDASRVGHISSILVGNIDPSLSYDGIELKTKSDESLGAIIYLNVDKSKVHSSPYKKLEEASLEIISLIGNAETLSIVGEMEGETELLVYLQKDDAEKILGENYFEKTKSLDGFLELSSKINSQIFGADEAKETKALENFSSAKISFPKADNMNDFCVVASFPNSWELSLDHGDNSIYLPGDFDKVLTIVDKEKNAPVGKIGARAFSPYEDEIDEESYYKTVYTELRMSSFFSYEPYKMVSRQDGRETGIADLFYLKPDEIENYLGRLPDCPSVETKAILSYNKDLGVYVALCFGDGILTSQELNQISSTLEIVSP